ncbi:MAG: metal-binding protein [Leptolyngbya sp. SIO1D8]|nr:metal-binding protein [Leptolyngbya sp. SIO1D8]
MGKPEQGRLVWNHSTHIPGLIRVLETLLAQEQQIQTVTPGRLSTVRSHAPKLRVKMSVAIRGGYKLIARKGKSAQEIFIVTSLEQAQLEEALQQAMDRQRS